MADNRIQLIIEAYNKTNTAFTQLGAGLKDISNNAKKTGSSVNALGQECRTAGGHVLGMVSAFAGIGGLADILRRAIGASIAYNKTLENSKLGLAAIITSMTDIHDKQGRTIEGAEKFAVSQQIAVAAQIELQKISQATTATYQELVEVYQGIVAPALSAKMTMEQTLEITGLLTNAVRALGLPINQIKQEARDLIQGGINAASSSLATALGISDAMVKKWRESGTVFGELKGRLEGFVYASKEMAGTWEGAWSNVTELMQKALGEGAKPLFEYLKRELLTVTEKLADIKRDAQGNIVEIKVKDEVKEKIRQLAVSIMELIERIKQLISLVIRLWDTFGKEALILGLGAKIGGLGLKFLELARKTGVATAAINTFWGTLALMAVGTIPKFGDEKNAIDMTGRIKSVLGAGDISPDIKATLEAWTHKHTMQLLEGGLTEQQIAEYLLKGIVGIKPVDTWHGKANRLSIDKEAMLADQSRTSDKSLQDLMNMFSVKGTPGESGEKTAKKDGKEFAMDEAVKQYYDYEKAVEAVYERLNAMTLGEFDQKRTAAYKWYEEQKKVLGDNFVLQETFAVELRQINEAEAAAAKKAWEESIDGLVTQFESLPRALQTDMLPLLDEMILKLSEMGLTGSEAFNRMVEARIKFNEGLPQIKVASDQLEASLKHLGNAMSSALESFFDYTSKGFGDWKTMISGLLNEIYMELIRVFVIKQLVGSFDSKTGTGSGIVGFFGSLLGGIGQQRHSGGMIIPKFHFGGLQGNERLAINKVGERYITQEQNQWLTNLGNTMKNMAGGGQETTVNYYIQANDPASFGDLIDKNPGRIHKIVSDSVRRNGSMRSAFKGAQ